jgi:hypothetical protein
MCTISFLTISMRFFFDTFTKPKETILKLVLFLKKMWSEPFRREGLERVTVSIRLYHQGKAGSNPCALERISGAFSRSWTWLVDQGISNSDQSLRSKYATSEHTAKSKNGKWVDFFWKYRIRWNDKGSVGGTWIDALWLGMPVDMEIRTAMTVLIHS